MGYKTYLASFDLISMKNCSVLLIVHVSPVLAKDIPFYTLIPNRMGDMLAGTVEVKFIGISIGSPPIEEHSTKFYSEWIQIDPTKIDRTKSYRLLAAFAKIKLLWRVLFLCRSNKIAVMNSMRHYDFFIIAFLIKLSNSKAIAIARVTGILPRDGNFKIVKRFRKTLAVLFERLTIGTCSSAVVLSEDLFKTLVRHGSNPLKLHVVSQGVNTENFNPRSRDSIALQPKKLLFVGRLNKLKGVEDSLLAYIELRRFYPGLNLTICGVGPEEPKLKSHYGAVDGITFLGFVDKDDLPSLYAACDILLLPSYSEGLPNVILEAMVSRLFVVASDVGGIKQLLSGGRGLIHEAGNIDEMVRILKNVMENTEMRLDYTDNAYRYAIEEHSFGAVRKKYLKLLNCGE